MQAGTKKRLSAELRNGHRARDCCVEHWRFIAPRRSASNHGVGKDEQLPGAGNKGLLVFLSGRDQPLVKLDKLRIPAKRRRQGSSVQGAAQPLSSAVDMPNTNMVAAIVVIGRKAGESDGLLARDPADLGQTHQDGNGGRQPDAVDAVDQLKSAGQVGMLADRGDQSLEFGLLALLQAGNIFLPELRSSLRCGNSRSGS